MIKTILGELRRHIPFTAFGAFGGIIFMIVFNGISEKKAHELFFVFHPLHVLLSALVTASLYQIHACPKKRGKNCSLFVLLVIGLLGSVGIATLSDSIMPYLGEILLDMPNRHHHIGFVEKWWLIGGASIVGIVVAYVNPTTKFPHFGHVLISTFASLFHIIMAKGQTMHVGTYGIVFIFLFTAVWIPCCVSDIVFPLLFVNKLKR